MPCNSDYMGQNDREKQLQETAQLTEFTLKALKRNVPGWVSAAAGSYYCSETRCAPMLCALIRGMDDATLNAVVYNARSADSRRLAEWWERHQEADKARIDAELAKAKRKELVKQAWAKLTEEEREALLTEGVEV